MGQEKSVVAVPKHSPKIMIWGGISWRGKTVLAVVNNSIKAYDYQQIMDGHLVQTMDTLYPDGWLYQQDNASPHTAKTTQQWFHDQNITVISWPPGSPDLNPIEIM